MDSIKTITLSPSGRQFESIPGRSILDAGLSAGLALPFRCANGSCGDCRARILQGTAHKHRQHDYMLTESEKSDGQCLLCSCQPDTDIVLEITEAQSVEDMPLQSLLAKRCQVSDLSGVTQTGFKFLRGKAFRFLPGQQARLEFDDGFGVTLPIASCPCNAQYVEFHLSDDQIGASLHTQLKRKVEQLKPLSKVTISGPLGGFTLSEHTQRAKVFVARGGGFCKLQGLIEHVFNVDQNVSCVLVWQATDVTGHYLHNLCRSWGDAVDEFNYVALGPEQSLIDALRQQITDWCNTEFYLAESDELLINALLQHGVNSESIYAAPECIAGTE